jgi:hypothetical protein
LEDPKRAKNTGARAGYEKETFSKKTLATKMKVGIFPITFFASKRLEAVEKKVAEKQKNLLTPVPSLINWSRCLRQRR